MRSVNQVFDERVVDSQTVKMMYGEDKSIQVDSFCDISYFSIELHNTYLGISGCHAVVAYKNNVAEQYIQVRDHCAVWVELPSISCSIVVICVKLDFTGRKFSHGSQDEGGMHQSESLGKKCRAEAWFSGEGTRSWSESEQLQSRGWDSWNKSLIPGAQQELVSKVHSIWDTLLQAEPRMSTLPDSSG